MECREDCVPNGDTDLELKNNDRVIVIEGRLCCCQNFFFWKCVKVFDVFLLLFSFFAVAWFGMAKISGLVISDVSEGLLFT